MTMSKPSHGAYILYPQLLLGDESKGKRPSYEPTCYPSLLQWQIPLHRCHISCNKRLGKPSCPLHSEQSDACMIATESPSESVHVSQGTLHCIAQSDNDPTHGNSSCVLNLACHTLPTTILPSHQRSYELFVLNDSSKNRARPCIVRKGSVPRLANLLNHSRLSAQALNSNLTSFSFTTKGQEITKTITTSNATGSAS